MKILERYVLNSFLLAFLLAWLVLTFVLSVGILMKVMALIAQGVEFSIILRYLLAGLPEILGMTIPLSLLVSALLVFGRLSADSEVSAMRACGVNFLTIMRWPLLVGLGLSLFCVWLNNEVAPRRHLVRRDIAAESSVVVGLEILEPGRFINDVPNMTLWFASKQGNWLNDVLVYDKRSTNFVREIRAKRALVQTNGNDVVLTLHQVRVDPLQDDRPGAAMLDRATHTLKNILRRKKYEKRIDDCNFMELRARLHDLPPPSERDKKAKVLHSQMLFELNNRFVWAAASFCFVLIGVPLGIKAHRKETTIGMAISLLVGVLFFLCLILAKAISKNAALHPWLLLWMPVLVCFVLAAYLIPKNQ